MLVMILFYGISVLWAIDAGMALIGFVKFLPVPLFLLALTQKDNSSEPLIQCIPFIATVMTVISFVGMLIPDLKATFSVAGRLAGFFEYPNTFALFLLVAELLLFTKKERKVFHYFMIIIIVAGLLLTGSRTVFVLAVLANIALLLLDKNRKVRICGIFGIVALIIAIMIYAIFFGGADAITRLFRISLEESTFVGRILYFVDAMPLIFKTPFGLGYMGYYYKQQTIQTGLYSIRSIHNDFLQLLLDIGWIPCLILVIAIIKTFLKKNVSIERKVILGAIVLHSCFDFNLQFVTMFWLLLLFIEHEEGKIIHIRKGQKILFGGAVGLAGLSIYLGLSMLWFYQGSYANSYKLYPGNTQAATMLLTEQNDIEEAGKIADRILEQNEYVTIAYSAKARQAYAKGDFGAVIYNKNELIRRAPFQYDEYEDYCYMLINGIALYQKAGDLESANICKRELIGAKTKLEEAEKKISVLGGKIKDQPVTQLPEDITKYINELRRVQ